MFCVFFPIGLIGLIGLITPIGLIALGVLRERLITLRGFAPLRSASPPANQGSPLRGFLSASLRSAEFGRAADAALARALPASITDGGDAVGTSRASARRTSGPIACPGAAAPG